MRIHNRRALKPIRRKLRNCMTSAEATMWLHLRSSQLHGRKFRRQHSIGPYIVDFYCPSRRLVLELDGATHDHPEAQERDAQRDRYLENLGLRIIRVRSSEVITNTEGVLAYVGQALEEEG
jgi:very-short-patch-repair endonuclease